VQTCLPEVKVLVSGLVTVMVLLSTSGLEGGGVISMVSCIWALGPGLGLGLEGKLTC
jgi:hypothetical protein